MVWTIATRTETKIVAPGVQGLEMLENGLQKAGQLVREAGALDDDPRLGGVEGVGELGQVGGIHVLHHGLQQAHHHQVQQHAPLQAVGGGGRVVILQFNTMSFLCGIRHSSIQYHKFLKWDSSFL
jgi:hypothetical protein